MRTFLAFMRYMSQFELAIAKSTGRNPEHLRALYCDVDRWDRALATWEINHA